MTEKPAEASEKPLRIGVSACILGQDVRYNGGHKHSHFVTGMLGRWAEFVPVCPEVELGLGVPRETLRLVRPTGTDDVRMVTTKTKIDHTDGMRRFAADRVAALGREALTGFIVQKGSPSCGMERVKIYPQGGLHKPPSPEAELPGSPPPTGGRRAPPSSAMAPRHDGRGLFTARLMEAFPDLPVEEDGRLNDPRLRENFVERIFAYRRVRDLFASDWTIGDLVAFHSREKLTLMAHHRPTYTALGRLVADAKGRDRAELAATYTASMMAGHKRLATTKKHTNVLQHIAGYFKRDLDAADRAEFKAVVDAFHRGLVPLVVPITLARHHIRRLDIDYLAMQTYLDPTPAELMLRNHV